MHRQLRSLLPTAEGRSQFVIAIFLDVRGFTQFAGLQDSGEAAVFLRGMYTKVLDSFLPDADFFKLTGDGLMVLYHYDASNLEARLNQVVNACVELIAAFPTICDGDAMVNFPVPQHLGIGLSRGSTTALASDDVTLDYSGRPLNLAARLMDFARPEGIVFDDSLSLSLLEPTLRKRFAKDTVYIKGIAELEPIVVHYLSGVTSVPESAHVAIGRYEWRVVKEEKTTLKELAERGSFNFPLPVEPAFRDRMELLVEHDKVTPGGRKSPSINTSDTLTPEYKQVGGKPYARIDFSTEVKELRARGVKDSWPITLELGYQVVPDAST